MISISNVLIGAFLLLGQAIAYGPVRIMATPTPNAIKVPGESPAYYCSNPSNDTFQISRLDFIPTNIRIKITLRVSQLLLRKFERSRNEESIPTKQTMIKEDANSYAVASTKQFAPSANSPPPPERPHGSMSPAA